MRKISTIMKRGLSASFLCLTALLVPATAVTDAMAGTKKAPAKTEKTKKVKKQNTFATPDFAFPQTVTANAEKEFEKAIAHGDGATALKAATQLCVAGNLVSQDSVQHSIARFRKVSETMHMPYDKLATLLEANLYSDIYSANQWTYDGRTLPLAPLPESVFEWSKPMFQQKVETLIKEAFADSSELATLPIENIAGLLEMPKKSETLPGMSVLDYMTLNALEALSPFGDETPIEETIPFGTGTGVAKEQPLALTLLDSAVARHENDSDKQLLAYFMQQKAGRVADPDRLAYLKSCVEKLGDTPYCAPLLTQYCNAMSQESEKMKSDNDLRRIKYDLLKGYAAKYPTGWNIADVIGSLKALTQQSAGVDFKSQALPGKEFKAKVNASNLYSLYVLVYKLPDADVPGEVKYSQLGSKGKLVKAIPVSYAGTEPDEWEKEITVPGLEPGLYTLVMSKTATGKSGSILDNGPEGAVSQMRVSDITTFTENGGEDFQTLHAVSAENGEPLKGATVKLYRRSYGKPAGTPVVKTADANGAVKVEKGSWDYCVTYGNDRYTDNTYYSHYRNDTPNKTYSADVLTSLSVYKPGQEAPFAAVVYSREGKRLAMAEEMPISAVLRDANWQSVDTLKLTTDRYGRANGTFTIPTTGLLGRYMIQIEAGGRVAGSQAFQVAEYKSPTFYAETELAEGDYKAGDVMKFTGRAMTYSGMPVGDAKVAYTVTYQPCWWWRSNGNSAQYGGETETDAQGLFNIELPTAGLKGTQFDRGGFRMNVSVTNPAGETQEAPVLSFALGDAYHVQPSFPGKIEVSGDTISLNVAVYNLAATPVKKMVSYTVSKDGKELFGGEFESPTLKLASTQLVSGEYEFKFKLAGEDDATEETASLVVYRAGDKVPPIKTALWVPEGTVKAAAGAKTVKVKVG